MIFPEFLLELTGYITGLEPKRLFTTKRFRDVYWYLAFLGIIAFGYLRWNAYVEAKQAKDDVDFDNRVFEHIPSPILNRATDEVNLASNKITSYRKLQQSIRNTSEQEAQGVTPVSPTSKTKP